MIKSILTRAYIVSKTLYSTDPVLMSREEVYEVDTGLGKIGDGTLKYSKLPYTLGELSFTLATTDLQTYAVADTDKTKIRTWVTSVLSKSDVPLRSNLKFRISYQYNGSDIQAVGSEVIFQKEADNKLIFKAVDLINGESTGKNIALLEIVYTHGKNTWVVNVNPAVTASNVSMTVNPGTIWTVPSGESSLDQIVNSLSGDLKKFRIVKSSSGTTYYWSVSEYGSSIRAVRYILNNLGGGTNIEVTVRSYAVSPTLTWGAFMAVQDSLVLSALEGNSPILGVTPNSTTFIIPQSAIPYSQRVSVSTPATLPFSAANTLTGSDWLSLFYRESTSYGKVRHIYANDKYAVLYQTGDGVSVQYNIKGMVMYDFMEIYTFILEANPITWYATKTDAEMMTMIETLVSGGSNAVREILTAPIGAQVVSY